MKTRIVLLINSFIFFSILSKAQIQQNIINTSGNVVSHPISEIDSIRFNSAGNQMQVVLQGGETQSHLLVEIDSVTFEEAGCAATSHTCGEPCVHNPNLSYGTMTDQQGNEYKTIVIGTQEWMAENLKTSIYRNGDAIANVTDNNEWTLLTTGAWCYFNNDSQYECPYGKLYNWYAAADARNVCPVGWHVPSDAEWNVLIGYLDPTYEPNVSGAQDTIAGGKMKTVNGWYEPNIATNESGFSGIPGDYRNFSGEFNFFGLSTGYWWSVTEFNPYFAWYRYLYSSNSSVTRYPDNKFLGMSVRCVKD